VGKAEAGFWTAANLLTLLRIALVPVFIGAVVRRSGTAAFAVFVLAACTDFLDGWAARAWGKRTKLGVTLDPAADKLLMTAAFIALSLEWAGGPNIIPLWLTGTVIGRDAAIALAALLVTTLIGPKPFLPSLWGKISTILQMGCIGLVLLLNMLGTMRGELRWAYYLTFAATVGSGLHYFVTRLVPWIRGK
jgi:cardiolipin synthase